MKKNECFNTVFGRKLWDGRYCCICGIVIYDDGNTKYILANKRGSGCPDFVGYWNMPCGYLDAGSGEENVAREVLEETGVNIDPSEFFEYAHSDLGKQRNVTFRYVAMVKEKYPLPAISELEGGEENEVSEIAWISEHDIENYEWAFNHKEIIKNILNSLNFLKII